MNPNDPTTPTPKHHRGDFLEVRRRYIREMVAEGDSFEEIARALSMDPGQVQLISMTETQVPCRYAEAFPNG